MKKTFVVLTALLAAPALALALAQKPVTQTETTKVDDPKKLQGVQPGDKIDVTYTEAFMITVQ